MNDDRLLEVLSHLDLPDLCAVADVCSRFRENANVTFVHSTYNHFNLPYGVEREWDGDSCNLLLLISQVLRLFGRYIDTIVASCWVRKLPPNYQRRIIELLVQYCSGFLKELTLPGTLELTDVLSEEITFEMRPLLKSLQALSICRASKLLRKMLPFWCTELRRLKIINVPAENIDGNIWRFHGLEKLVWLSLYLIHDLTNDDVREVLKSNPELKTIYISQCANIAAFFRLSASMGQLIVCSLRTFLEFRNNQRF